MKNPMIKRAVISLLSLSSVLQISAPLHGAFLGDCLRILPMVSNQGRKAAHSGETSLHPLSNHFTFSVGGKVNRRMMNWLDKNKSEWAFTGANYSLANDLKNADWHTWAYRGELPHKGFSSHTDNPHAESTAEIKNALSPLKKEGVVGEDIARIHLHKGIVMIKISKPEPRKVGFVANMFTPSAPEYRTLYLSVYAPKNAESVADGKRHDIREFQVGLNFNIPVALAEQIETQIKSNPEALQKYLWDLFDNPPRGGGADAFIWVRNGMMKPLIEGQSGIDAATPWEDIPRAQREKIKDHFAFVNINQGRWQEKLREDMRGVR